MQKVWAQGVSDSGDRGCQNLPCTSVSRKLRAIVRSIDFEWADSIPRRKVYQSATLSVATVAGDKEGGGENASFPAPCASGHRGGTVITLALAGLGPTPAAALAALRADAAALCASSS